MNNAPPVIVWFRQDLRRADNPALTAAADSGHSVLPVYILDDANAGNWQIGAASRWWLQQSLMSLNESLCGHLRYFRGDGAEILTRLAQDLDVAGVYWNRCYEPWRIDRDRQIEAALKVKGCSVESLNARYCSSRRVFRKPTDRPTRYLRPSIEKDAWRTRHHRGFP